MSSPPADGEYWCVIRIADGTRAVAHATLIGRALHWVLLDELADPTDVYPVFKVELQPHTLQCWQYYVAIDPQTRERMVARLVPLEAFEDGPLGWDVADREEPLKQAELYPLWPLHSV